MYNKEVLVPLNENKVWLEIVKKNNLLVVDVEIYEFVSNLNWIQAPLEKTLALMNFISCNHKDPDLAGKVFQKVQKFVTTTWCLFDE